MATNEFLEYYMQPSHEQNKVNKKNENKRKLKRELAADRHKAKLKKEGTPGIQ